VLAALDERVGRVAAATWAVWLFRAGGVGGQVV